MRHRRLALLFAFALAAVTAGVAFASAAPAVGPNEFAPSQEVNRPTPNIDTGYAAPRAIPGHTGQIKNGTPGLSDSFAGLSLFDSASQPNNYHGIEPPDQGLCTNGSLVLEATNLVMGVYDTSGSLQGSMSSLNQFFTKDYATTGVFLSDPKCYWDPRTEHWYFTVLEIDDNGTAVLVAVTKGTTPSTNPNDWWEYAIDTTNNGGPAHDRSSGATPDSRTLPTHYECPCFGDQPLIGADAYGFYISTNEYGGFFNAAQIYALDKYALDRGVLRMQYVLQSDYNGDGTWSPDFAHGYTYSLQPATSPTATSWELGNNGTEYFLSALDFDGTLDNRIAAWAMTNTRSLQGTPNVHLEPYVIVDSEVYGQPPPADQKSGPTPLGAYLGDPESYIETNDDRMNQVVYADGHLWSGVNTVMRTDNGRSTQTTRAGIAWFIVEPNWDSGFGASMANQGYVSAKNNDNAMFPSIGVNADGKGVMTFTVAGHHYYPSAAYAPIDLSGVGPTHIAATGAAPADGFSGYAAFGYDGVERWGDYSAAVGLPDGSVWAAAEWIPGTFGFNSSDAHPLYANWGTYVMHVTP